MTFTLTHLVGLKNDFSDRRDSFSDKGLSIVERESDIDFLLELIERVGYESCWHERRAYHDKKALLDLDLSLQKPKARLWLFQKDEVTVGFCQALDMARFPDGFRVFSGKIVEIYKLGLFPEYCGMGMGNFYVLSVLQELFKENDVVYLNTRDTNRVNSVPFYQNIGMRILSIEKKPDDLVHHEGVRRVLTG